MGVNGTRTLVPIHESAIISASRLPLIFFNISEQLCFPSISLKTRYSIFFFRNLFHKQQIRGGGFQLKESKDRFKKCFRSKRYSPAKESFTLYFCWMYGCARLLSIEAPELNSQITLLLFSLGDEGPVLTRISIFLLLLPTLPPCPPFSTFTFKPFQNDASKETRMISVTKITIIQII